jgi:predicted MFS family arabinose efflux permease
MSDVSSPPVIGPRLITLMAIACGIMVANLYYAQALIGEIAPALGLAPGSAGLVVTVTQLGYGAGLFFIVSLADLVENRRLILIMTMGACIGEFGIFLSHGAASFLAFACLTGFCSVGAQIMVPLAAHLAPDHRRGRVVGNIMGGLIAGIMLSRPLANGLAAVGGWRTVFAVSSGAMALLVLVLARTLPERQPKPGLHYGQILLSGLKLLVREPAIRRRTAYQAAIFAVFNLFWTTVPLLLGHSFGLGQAGLALFALAGAGGALAAPFAGHVADRGHVRAGTALALASAVVACGVAGWAGMAGALLTLAAAAVLLDAATQTNQVLGQRVLYSIAPEARGRINAVYMTIVFLAAAIGSILGSFSYERGGWMATTAVGAIIVGAALLLFASEPRQVAREVSE